MWSRRSMILDTNPQHEFYAHFEKVKAELDKNKEHWENRDSVVLRVNKSPNWFDNWFRFFSPVSSGPKMQLIWSKIGSMKSFPDGVLTERRSTSIDITQWLNSAISVFTGTFYSLLFAMMIKPNFVSYTCLFYSLFNLILINPAPCGWRTSRASTWSKFGKRSNPRIRLIAVSKLDSSSLKALPRGSASGMSTSVR